MRNPPLAVKAAVLFGLFTSALGLYWLASMATHSLPLMDRLGYVAAVFSVLALCLICWSAIMAHIALLRQWSPLACMRLGASVAIVGLALFFFASGGLHSIGLILGTQGFIARFLCRKLAYPHMTEKEFQDFVRRSHEPPLIFPR